MIHKLIYLCSKVFSLDSRQTVIWAWMSAIHMYMWVYECMVYDFCMYTMHDYIYIYINIYTHIHGMYIYISTYIYIYLHIYIYIYIYRKARRFQEYHCTTAYLQVFCFMTLQQLWSASALVVSGQKKQQPPATKKNRKFPGLSRKSRKSGRRVLPRHRKNLRQFWLGRFLLLSHVGVVIVQMFLQFFQTRL